LRAPLAGLLALTHFLETGVKYVALGPQGMGVVWQAAGGNMFLGCINCAAVLAVLLGQQ
jgi:hypothetical protein